MQIKHLQMLAFSVVTPSIHGSKSLGRPAEYLVNVYGVAAKAYNFARQEVLNSVRRLVIHGPPRKLEVVKTCSLGRSHPAGPRRSRTL